MTNSVAVAKGSGALRPRARLLHTLGDELISSETVAIIELVKNAYDADANSVLVRFHGKPEATEGGIEIIDDGHGMSLDTIRTTWMEPATLNKKRSIVSERRRRRVLGEKGIGRFASAKLATTLEVVTRRYGTDTEVIALFDWSQFDDEERYLDQIEVLWEERQPAEIIPDGNIEGMMNNRLPNRNEDFSHGTILRMQQLRTTWSLDMFKALQLGLSRLVSPFSESHIPSHRDDFQIYLETPEPFSDLSGTIEPPEGLRDPHYRIVGSVESDGSVVTPKYRTVG